ncbi:MAG: hypothetical protein IK130_11460 [Oscillospiraceae bacterium]|nr:hypothetical protein [Oscillospiraceae bacterium]
MTRYLLLAAAVLTAPLLCGGVWQTPDPKEQLPDWVTLDTIDEDVTVNTGSGTETVHVNLKDGALSITGEHMEFTSESDWIVCGCYFNDLDRDGADEVMLHLWKGGVFGPYQPFWREQDDKSVYTERLFIYNWNTEQDDRLKIAWGSSRMARTGKEVWIDDNHFVRILSVDGTETAWRWEYWGLKLVGEKKPGES